jgi:hypothetical protein
MQYTIAVSSPDCVVCSGERRASYTIGAHSSHVLLVDCAGASSSWGLVERSGGSTAPHRLLPATED